MVNDGTGDREVKEDLDAHALCNLHNALMIARCLPVHVEVIENSLNLLTFKIQINQDKYQGTMIG